MNTDLLPKGTIFRRREDKSLWKVVGVTARFNSGNGGASYHLRSLDNPKHQDSILWVCKHWGHPEYELADGLEQAIGKISLDE